MNYILFKLVNSKNTKYLNQKIIVFTIQTLYVYENIQIAQKETMIRKNCGIFYSTFMTRLFVSKLLFLYPFFHHYFHIRSTNKFMSIYFFAFFVYFVLLLCIFQFRQVYVVFRKVHKQCIVFLNQLLAKYQCQRIKLKNSIFLNLNFQHMQVKILHFLSQIYHSLIRNFFQ